MLNAVGIISEYNPFHNGHLYQIKKAKELTHADLCIVVMSGNWVQRGQPASFDKWNRAKMALENDVDLVVELPFQYSVQPASIFAKSAVNILGALQCKWLSFGSENPEMNFSKLATVNLENPEYFKNYEENYTSAIQQLIAEKTGFFINKPNDILAFNYALYNRQLSIPMKLIPVKRKSSNHNDVEIIDSSLNISSATSIRKNINNVSKIYNVIPKSTLEVIENNQCIDWNTFWKYLKYKILTNSVNELRSIYQMTEGLEYRFKKYIKISNDFDEFLNNLKTKRYTFSRLRRLCVYVLMNFKSIDFENSSEYIRILGFNSVGRKYLKQIKKKTNMIIISNPSKALLEKELKFDYLSGNIYSIESKKNEDLYKVPLIF